MENNKRGISPVMATVLLIGIVIIAGIIIFLWLRNITQSATVKFGKNIELACRDVDFDASYSSGTLSISNGGNVPLYDLQIRIYGDKNYETKKIREISKNWPASGLSQGETFSDTIDIGSAKKILIIPILIGNSKTGRKTSVCKEGEGVKIEI